MIKKAYASLLACLHLTLTACGIGSVPQLKPLSDDAVILAFGDSLTFGVGSGSPNTLSYPAVLSQLSNRTVINSGVPGEVSREGLERLQGVLNQTKPDLVVLCHGANDLMLKIPENQIHTNIEQMIELIQQSGAQAVLVAVPTFSNEHQVPEFFEAIAHSKEIPIQRTVLRDIESDDSLKFDVIHANERGYHLFANSVYQLLKSTGAIKS